MISVVILAKNEADTIEQCLDSLAWCDEILMVDDYATDATVVLAKKRGVSIIQKHLENNFAAQRNYGLQHATHEWVLFVDADEIVSQELATEIKDVVANEKTKKGYSLHRHDIVWGKRVQHGEIGNVQLVRLGKKDAGEWRGKVHEVWDIRGEIGALHHPLLHYPHQTLTAFLQEINFYTDIRARELLDQKKKTNALAIVLYPLGKLFLNIVIKQGYKDGTVGVVVALLMSFHSFLVRGKLWFLWQKK